MRLIDADALERHVYTEWVNGELSNSEWVDFRQWLKDEPTVEAASPWHRVEEPPKENGRYLVSWEVAVTTDEYKDGVWLYSSMFNQRLTHWMPLPEPPKEDA